MIEIRVIDAQRSADVCLPNEPFTFKLFGKIVPSYNGTSWT